MSQPEATTTSKPNASLLIRGAIWIAIGALIAAALVCVIWVLIGDQDGLIGRAFLTILLLAAFAGIAILEAGLAPNRPDWLALSSMITWIIALLVGAVKIWLPEDAGDYYGSGAERFFQLILVIGILQLALLHVRLFTPAAERFITVFTRVIYYLTLVFLVALVGLLVFFLTFPHTFDYDDLYWRIVVALAILAAVGTTLIPLLNALFAPRKPRPTTPAAPALQQWPTYADGVTPLPVLADGSPDWNAYYTGQPSAPAAAIAPAAYPVAPGYGVAVPAAQPYPVSQPAPVWPAQDAAPAAPEQPAHAPAAPEAPVSPGAEMPAAPAAPVEHPPVPTPAEPVPPAPEQPAPPAQGGHHSIQPGAFPPPPPLPPQQ